MNRRLVVLWAASWAVAIAFVGGCRRDPYADLYIDAMNAEYRQLEDELYALEADYEDKLRRLRAYEETAASGTAGGSRVRDTDVPADAPKDPAGDGGAGRGSLRPRDDTRQDDLLPPRIDPGELLPPQIDPGDLRPPQVEFPRPDVEPAPGPAELPPDRPSTPPAFPIPPDTPRRPESAAKSTVSHVTLDVRRTQVGDLDGQPGEDGLTVVIVPRDETHRFAAEPGAVAIVVLDPISRTRVGRWDFSVEEVAGSLDERGILLRCPWPPGTPSHKHLHLFVRYHRRDGSHVQTDRLIEVGGRSLTAQRWTPRSRPDLQATAAQPRPRPPRPVAPAASVAPDAPHAPDAPDVKAESPAARIAETGNDPPAVPRWQPFR